MESCSLNLHEKLQLTKNPTVKILCEKKSSEKASTINLISNFKN